MEGKHTTLLNLTDRDDRLRKRYDDITQAGIKIHTLIQVVEFVSFLKFIPSKFDFAVLCMCCIFIDILAIMYTEKV